MSKQVNNCSNCEHYVFVKMSKHTDRGYGPYSAEQAEYLQRRFVEDGFEAEVSEVTGVYP
jgi:hypothetical protein